MKMCPHKDLTMHLHSIFIHNGQNLEVSQMSIKQVNGDAKYGTSIHTMEYYSAVKKGKTTDTLNSVHESQNHHAK